MWGVSFSLTWARRSHSPSSGMPGLSVTTGGVPATCCSRSRRHASEKAASPICDGRPAAPGLKATLHLSSRWFEDARLTIRLLPRPLPVQWALSRWRQQQETLTFEADMGFPPGFHLDVIRHRWSGHSGTKTSGSKASACTRAWTISRPGPVILTTKEDWPVELNPVVNALASWRDKDFVGVRFNSTSPHFTATVALENLSDQKAASALLGLFRELAASSSAKQH